MNDETPREIRPGVLYRVEEAQRRLGIGAWGWRQMRRAGLPVIYAGKKAFVLGTDLIAHLSRYKGQQAGAECAPAPIDHSESRDASTRHDA